MDTLSLEFNVRKYKRFFKVSFKFLSLSYGFTCPFVPSTQTKNSLHESKLLIFSCEIPFFYSSL